MLIAFLYHHYYTFFINLLKIAKEIDVLWPFHHIITIIFFINLLKYCLKTTIIFFSHSYKDGTTEAANAQKIRLNRIVGVVNALSKSEKRKREDNIIKDIFF